MRDIFSLEFVFFKLVALLWARSVVRLGGWRNPTMDLNDPCESPWFRHSPVIDPQRLASSDVISRVFEGCCSMSVIGNEFSSEPMFFPLGVPLLSTLSRFYLGLLREELWCFVLRFSLFLFTFSTEDRGGTSCGGA